MINNYKVSVILTSYNHAKFISQSIESVLNQTYKNFELIIWDDASTDESWEIINSYSDPRIKAFRNEVNTRKSIRFGLEIAQGDYIAIHHSDDAWEPDKLEKQVEILDQNPNIAAVFTHARIIDEDGRPFSNENHFYYKVFEQPNRTRYEWLNYFFYHGNCLCHPSILIRKDCFNVVMYRKGLALIPDFDMWVQLCFKYEIYIIQEKLTLFRVRDNEANVSGDHRSNRVRGQFEFLKVMDHYKNISSIDELLRIFPEAEIYLNKLNPNILYTLGKFAVESGPINPIKLFGLNLLFDEINHPERASKLEKFQKFDRKTFTQLTAENDIFSFEELRKLNREINERDQHNNHLSTEIIKHDQSIKQLTKDLVEREQSIQQLSSEVAKREQEVLFYALSKSWRITRPLRKIMNWLTGKSR